MYPPTYPPTTFFNKQKTGGGSDLKKTGGGGGLTSSGPPTPKIKNGIALRLNLETVERKRTLALAVSVLLSQIF